MSCPLCCLSCAHGEFCPLLFPFATSTGCSDRAEHHPGLPSARPGSEQGVGAQCKGPGSLGGRQIPSSRGGSPWRVWAVPEHQGQKQDKMSAALRFRHSGRGPHLSPC